MRFRLALALGLVCCIVFCSSLHAAGLMARDFRDAAVPASEMVADFATSVAFSNRNPYVKGVGVVGKAIIFYEGAENRVGAGESEVRAYLEQSEVTAVQFGIGRVRIKEFEKAAIFGIDAVRELGNTIVGTTFDGFYTELQLSVNAPDSSTPDANTGSGPKWRLVNSTATDNTGGTYNTGVKASCDTVLTQGLEVTDALNMTIRSFAQGPGPRCSVVGKRIDQSSRTAIAQLSCPEGQQQVTIDVRQPADGQIAVRNQFNVMGMSAQTTMTFERCN